jgi:phosphate ABC transporter phosphate-binding protein
MPTPTTNQEFLDLVVESGLLTLDHLRPYGRMSGTGPDGVRALAEQMVKDRILTTFQARQLLGGKIKGFFLADKYKVLALVGNGTLGPVLLCEQLEGHRLAAVKLLQKMTGEEFTSRIEAFERFIREMRVSASLNHPNIICPQEVDHSGSLPIVVSDYVDGSDLRHIVSETGVLPIPRAAHCIWQASLGLHHAHTKNLVHRAVNPWHLLLDRAGVLKVVDFGLMQYLGEPSPNPAPSEEQASAPSFDFLAPEQLTEGATLDHRTDLYSLGATFYYLLTGKAPFEKESLADKVNAMKFREPTPVREMRAEIPAPLADIVARMMAKNPRERFESLKDVALALDAWVRNPLPPPPAAAMPAVLPSAYKLGLVSGAGKAAPAATAWGPLGDNRWGLSGLHNALPGASGVPGGSRLTEALPGSRPPASHPGTDPVRSSEANPLPAYRPPDPGLAGPVTSYRPPEGAPLPGLPPTYRPPEASPGLPHGSGIHPSLPPLPAATTFRPPEGGPVTPPGGAYRPADAAPPASPGHPLLPPTLRVGQGTPAEPNAGAEDYQPSIDDFTSSSEAELERSGEEYHTSQPPPKSKRPLPVSDQAGVTPGPMQHTKQPMPPLIQPRQRSLTLIFAAGLATLVVVVGGIIAYRMTVDPPLPAVKGPQQVPHQPEPIRETPKDQVPTPKDKKVDPAIDPRPNPKKDPVVQPVAAAPLMGTGSSFIKPAMERWSDLYRDKTGVVIEYKSIGSGRGVENMIDKVSQFACTDAFLTEKQITKAKSIYGDVVHIPLAMGAVVVTYNLPKVPQPLRFTGAVLADIYLGNITKWNHEAIVASNPGAELPNLDITVVRRSDSSGTTFIWTDYLRKVSPEWKDKIGYGNTVNWPKVHSGEDVEKNEGMAKMVREKPGAIGYVELAFALEENMKFAKIKNRANKYVEPSLDNITAAANESLQEIPADLRYTITDPPGEESYPIAGTTWAVLYINQSTPKNPGQGKELVKFLRWVVHDGQKVLKDLRYASLPPRLIERVDEKLATIQTGE